MSYILNLSTARNDISPFIFTKGIQFWWLALVCRLQQMSLETDTSLESKVKVKYMYTYNLSHDSYTKNLSHDS